MSTKSILVTVFSIMAIAIAAAWYIDNLNLANSANNYISDGDEILIESVEPVVFGEEQARMIAERECIKGGEALGSGTYNEATKTWWFDANLNAIQPGCDPACVVSEKTRMAEINWRCTGAIPPSPGGKITNFKECVAAGNPIRKSNPAQCEANGVIYLDEVGQSKACTDESRKADACGEILDPVCATVEIQCIKAPCDPVWQTFPNPCEACLNPLVITYTTGECETPDAEEN